MGFVQPDFVRAPATCLSDFCISAEEFDVGREILEEAYEQQHRGDIQLEPKTLIQ